jgi:hypothetical protein
MSTQFFCVNEIENALAVVSSENAQFPLTNLNDPRRSKVFRSTSNSTTLSLDFGYPVLINSVMMVDDPMTGNHLLNCHVKIDNASDFSTALEGDMAIDSANGFSFVDFTTTVPVRYLQLVMTSTGGFCEIAKLFAGAKVDLASDVDFSLPFTFEYIDRSTVSINRFGQEFVDETNTQKRISGSMKALTKDELDPILDMVKSSGKTKPVWVKFDSILNNANELSGYYKLNANRATLDSSLHWSTDITLIEAL